MSQQDNRLYSFNTTNSGVPAVKKLVEMNSGSTMLYSVIFHQFQKEFYSKMVAVLSLFDCSDSVEGHHRVTEHRN